MNTLPPDQLARQRTIAAINGCSRRHQNRSDAESFGWRISIRRDEVAVFEGRIDGADESLQGIPLSYAEKPLHIYCEDACVCTKPVGLFGFVEKADAESECTLIVADPNMQHELDQGARLSIVRDAHGKPVHLRVIP